MNMHVTLLHVYDLHEGTWSLYNVAQRTTTIALDREDRRGHIKPCQAARSAFVRASKSVWRAVYATLSVDN
jgi:hypothetical protein